MSYSERLAMLDLDTLECRRLKADLILYYKIVNNLTSFTSTDYFNFNVHVRDTRLAAESNSFCISQPLCKTVCFENDFFQRCISCWNSLSTDTVESSTLKQFKCALDNCDLSTFLKYEV